MVMVHSSSHGAEMAVTHRTSPAADLRCKGPGRAKVGKRPRVDYLYQLRPNREADGPVMATVPELLFLAATVCRVSILQGKFLSLQQIVSRHPVMEYRKTLHTRSDSFVLAIGALTIPV